MFYSYELLVGSGPAKLRSGTGVIHPAGMAAFLANKASTKVPRGYCQGEERSLLDNAESK